jgi:hypothetical protein
LCLLNDHFTVLSTLDTRTRTFGAQCSTFDAAEGCSCIILWAVSTQPTRTTSSIRSLMPMLFPCLAYGHVRSPSPGPKSYPSRVCLGRGFSCSGGTRNVVDKSRYTGDAGLGGLPNGCEYFYHSLAFDKPEPKRVFFFSVLAFRFIQFVLVSWFVVTNYYAALVLSLS